MASWNLQEEGKKIINQWYFILGFLIVGIVLGYAVTWVFPAPYRATAEVYVGIDITRVNDMTYLIPLAEEEPLNLDDYKNWQLKQLADIFYSDPVLKAALEDLQKSDSAWEGYTVEELRNGTDIYWYDTGIWRLEFLHSEKDLARTAVQAWLDAGYQRISDLLVVAEDAAALDMELEINRNASTVLKLQAARLAAFQESAGTWLDVTADIDPDGPLPDELYLELVGFVDASLADAGELLTAVEDLPLKGADAADFRTWAQETSSAADSAQAVIQRELEILSQEREEKLPGYHESLEKSLGLSANIVLEENTSGVRIEKLRSPGTNALAGGVLGLLAWLVFIILQIKGPRDGQD